MDQVAIIKAIKFLVDAAKDIIKASQGGQNLLQRIEDFANLIPDAIDELGSIGDLQNELKNIKPTDVPALAQILVADIGFQDIHALAIATAALNVLETPSIATIEALIKVITSKDAPVA